MTKHTPGPWYADKIEDRNAYNIFPVGQTHALVTVAAPIHDGAHPYALATEANAALISAAPELLAALNDLLDQCKGRAVDRSKALSAIARATFKPAKYDLAQIARELELTALGQAHYGNALRVAKDIPGLTDQDRALLDRFATGANAGTDHIALQDLSNRVAA